MAQAPKSYTFTVESAGETKEICLIDTPGIGDVNGINQDKQNFEKIFDFLADIK